MFSERASLRFAPGVCVIASLSLGCGAQRFETRREATDCTPDARATGPADPLYDDALAATDRWIAEHPTEWRIAIDDSEGAHALSRPTWSEPCESNPQSGLVVLRYEASGLGVDFHFRCPLADASSAEGLQAAFAHVALHRLPHGISLPHWTMEVITPVSSFEEGVVFERVADSRLAVTITTELYAVRGHSDLPECEPPADASSEPCCYVHREHRPTLHLSMRVPYSPAALEEEEGAR